MFRIVIMFSILSIFGCKTSERKLKIETVMGKYEKVSRTAENGAHMRYQKLMPLTPLLEPTIDDILKKDNLISYNLNGHIASGGRTIYRIKNIRKEEVLQNDTLFIKHYVEIKIIPGKEGSLVVGYNYSQKMNQKLPATIQHVHIELYHQYQNKETKKVMAEEIINL